MPTGMKNDPHDPDIYYQCRGGFLKDGEQFVYGLKPDDCPLSFEICGDCTVLRCRRPEGPNITGREMVKGE